MSCSLVGKRCSTSSPLIKSLNVRVRCCDKRSLKFNPVIIKVGSRAKSSYELPNTFNVEHTKAAMSVIQGSTKKIHSTVDSVSETDEISESPNVDNQQSSDLDASQTGSEKGAETCSDSVVSNITESHFVFNFKSGIAAKGETNSGIATVSPTSTPGNVLIDKDHRAASENDSIDYSAKTLNESIKQEKEDDDEGTGGFSCEICSEGFLQESKLIVHKNEAHNLHEINYDNFDVYIEHTTGALPFRCRICGKGFTRKQTAKHHHVVHTGETPFSCLVCQKSFRHRSALYKHKRSHSAAEPAKYPCEVCGKSFKHKSYLSIHAVIHTEERPYVCDICGSAFKDRSARNKHIHAHSGVRPYSCDICGKCFGRKGDYKSHLVIHTDNRPYVCSECGRSFQSNSNCRRHARIHTNSYPFECEVCGKAFNQNWKLNEHKYIHSDEAPYVCMVCGAAFRHSRKLKKHLTEHDQGSPNLKESVKGEDDCMFEIISVQPDISALIE